MTNFKNIRLNLILLIIGFSLGLSAQTGPLTVAEKTGYASTSLYSDVMTFIDTLLKRSPNIKMEILAQSAEGRDIPLLVIADPMPASPADMLSDKRMVVYLQANIHAGEVEGKEASLMLARDLLASMDRDIFNNLVVLICPILNADGNEKVSTQNRTNQNGPLNGVGVRHNGQYLDLNRDAMKLETPEFSGVVSNIFNRWDPAISVDCHTTNGSFHEEPITFTWMMNPNGDRNLINYMRDKMMPVVHNNLIQKYEVENIFYGEFIDRLKIDSGWISYASEPRYLVNYAGVRNRLAILNENYVYADFKTRVNGCYYLLRSILDYSAIQKDEIKQLLKNADEKMKYRGSGQSVNDSFAITYEGRPTPELITIKAIEADTIPGVKGYWRYRQSDRKRTVTVPYIADYYALNNVAVPYAYLLPLPANEVISVLNRHGIIVEKLTENVTLAVEKFVITGLKGSERLNQGHYNNTMNGHFVTDTIEFRAGTYVIKTSQNLGNLVSYLLEPQSDDGLLFWNFFDKYLVPQWGEGYYPYPVFKLERKVEFQ